MIAAKEQTHMLLDNLDIDWVFTRVEVQTFREMWVADFSINSIADEMDRKPLEIALLIIEQAELGEIKVRQQGIFGQ